VISLCPDYRKNYFRFLIFKLTKNSPTKNIETEMKDQIHPPFLLTDGFMDVKKIFLTGINFFYPSEDVDTPFFVHKITNQYISHLNPIFAIAYYLFCFMSLASFNSINCIIYYRNYFYY